LKNPPEGPGFPGLFRFWGLDRTILIQVNPYGFLWPNVQSLRPFYTASPKFSITVSQTAGETHGSLIYRIGIRLFRRHGGARLRLRKAEEAAMNWIYILSGLLALAIFVYLIVALFFPEKF